MIVDFEFLDTEPIENVITNLNFQVDKTVFFGYVDNIKAHRITLEKFLAKYCGDPSVEFITVPRGKLKETLNIMRTAVEREKAEGNMVFFDITGGETIPMVAFGILSTETETPMHIFNVERNKIKEQEEGAEDEISKMVPRRNIDFTIDMLAELRGAAIAKKSNKENKLLENADNIANAKKLIKMFEKYAGDWTEICRTINGWSQKGKGGLYRINYDKLGIRRRKDDEKYVEILKSHLQGFVSQMNQRRLIEVYLDEKGRKYFRFVDKFVEKNVCESGAALELKMCLELRDKYGSAEAGVHLDWDGEINTGRDVLNEIDVVALDGYTPIIVSCKCGNQADRNALYELETVARRFGGKYCRKIMVSARNMSEIDKARAEEMDIEVMILDKSRKVKKSN